MSSSSSSSTIDSQKQTALPDAAANLKLVKNVEPRTPVTFKTLWHGFGGPFEREYRRERAAYLATVSRAMVVLSIFLYACNLLWDALTVQQLTNPLVYFLVFGVMAPSSLIAARLTYRRNPNRRFRLSHITVLGLAGNSISLIILTTWGPTHGIPWPYEWLAVNILYALFLIGLVVRIAVPAAAAVVFTVTLGNLWMGLDSAILVHETFFLSLVLVLGGIAAMLHERIDRDVWVAKRQLREQVMRDALTGLYNRRYVFDHGTMLLRQAQRDGQLLAALLIDVDHFKRLNDSAGHQAGDQALRDVAAVLEAHAQRSFDIAGRIGGEEFVLLLYNCDQQSLAAVAEAVRTNIEQQRIAHPAVQGGVLTVSVGAATTTANRGESFEQLLARADKALYQAKADGRNCSRLL